VAITWSNQGVAQSATASATLVIGSNTGSVGDILVVLIAADNAGTLGATSIASVTDGSNTYTLRGSLTNNDPGAAEAGVTLGIYTSVLTVALSNANITVNFSPNTTRKCAQVYRGVPGAADIPKFFAAGAGATGTSNATTITNSSVANGYTIFGAAAVETDDAITADSDTTNGSWSTIRTTLQDDGADANTMTLSSQWKTVSATAAQTFNLGIAGAQDWATNWITIYPSKKIVVDVATYSFSPSTVGMLVKRKFVPESASYVFSPDSVTLTHTIPLRVVVSWAEVQVAQAPLVVGAASYTFTPSDVTLRKGLRFGVDAASYVFTPSDVVLRQARKVVPLTTSYVFFPSDVVFKKGFRLAVDGASYVFSPSAVSFVATESLKVVISWAEVESADAPKTIAIGAAAYVFSPTDVTFKLGKKLAIGAASYVFSPTDVTFRAGRKVAIGGASYSFVPSDVTLRKASKVVIGGATYTLNVADMSFVKRTDKFVNMASASYLFTPADVSFRQARKIAIDAASYLFSPASVAFVKGKRISIEGAAYVFSPSDVEFVYSGAVPGGGAARINNPFVASTGAMMIR